MKGLSVEWTKHLKDPDRKAGFEKTLRNNTLIMDRLYDILTEWERLVLASETNPADYDAASWSHKQAHRNGNREIIKKLKDLVGFTKG